MQSAVQLVSAPVPGRVRYRSAAFLRDPIRAAHVQSAITAIPGVRRAEANARTGSVLVLFDPRIPRGELEPVLCDALGAVLATPATRATVIVASTRVRSEADPAVGARAVHTPNARAGVHEVAYHALELHEVCREIGVAAPGHDHESAAHKLAAEGHNALTPPPRRSELRMLLDQLASTPVLLLGASALFSAATGGSGDALAIVVVIGINATIGYLTESRAERTIAAITSAPPAHVPVMRAGKATLVAVELVARGDLLVLSAGVFVAADARIVQDQDLTVDESSLTGESVPVLKSTATALDASLPLGERSSMVYRGTLVTGGSAVAMVVAIGDHTEVGQIQSLASAVEARQTPMQKQLDQLGTQLAIGSAIACSMAFGLGMLRGQPLLPMLRTAISLGVAAVPEGLPTVAITTLALGLARMRERHVLVRKLAAVETLGAVQVVCFDKTGTLTVNRMTVVELTAGLERLRLNAGILHDAADRPADTDSSDLGWLLRVAVLCNEVELRNDSGVSMLQGSPTEAALVQLALDLGFDVDSARAYHPLLGIQRRAQTRNYMSTSHARGEERLVAIKGRPSEVLALCGTFLRNGERLPLTYVERDAIETHNEHMAARALRVLGLAFRDGALAHDDPAPDLVWLGLIAMEDPPRPAVPALIERFHRAGLRTVMITGDQSATAKAVAVQAGLARDGRIEIVDSTRLDRVEPEVLRALAQRAHVFSRVSPAHKLQIVQALQHDGQVVAMTGDGVNDGPALKAADIGIAMGSSGSNAACAIADVVLEDDELETLVAAIEQGRTIYADIRKAVHFILATNLGEILYTLAGAAGLGQPLSPMQLLWINLLTDVFPELALAVEPPEADVLTRPPRDPRRPMFTRSDLLRIGGEGTVITAGALSAYMFALARYGLGPQAGTVGFTALTLAQLLHAFSARSETHSFFDRQHLARNRWLPLSVAGTMGLQVAGNLLPPLRRLLGTTRMSLLDWATVLAAAGAPFLVNETIKHARTRGAHAAGLRVQQ